MTEIITEKKLSPAQLKAIETLLTCGSVSEAASAANVTTNTIYRWMKDDAFLTALRAAEGVAIAGLSRALAGLGESATSVLRAALGEDQKMNTRLRAVEIVIGNLLRLRELVDLEERVATLEANNAKQP